MSTGSIVVSVRPPSARAWRDGAASRGWSAARRSKRRTLVAVDVAGRVRTSARTMRTKRVGTPMILDATLLEASRRRSFAAPSDEQDRATHTRSHSFEALTRSVRPCCTIKDRVYGPASTTFCSACEHRVRRDEWKETLQSRAVRSIPL